MILLYHRVTELKCDPWSLAVTPAHFSEHLQVLHEWYQPVRLTDLAAALHSGDLSKGWVALTFDDGYADNLHEARPILARYGIPATMFLVAGAIGSNREFWWDELERILLTPGRLPETLCLEIGPRSFSWNLGAAARHSEEEIRRHAGWKARETAPGPRQELFCELWERLRLLPAGAREDALNRLLSWAGLGPAPRSSHRVLDREEVQELASDGFIDIGAHTMTHPVLSSLSLVDQQTELEQGKAILEGIVGPGTVTSFAYPFGKAEDYGADTVTLVREAGYRSACLNMTGPVLRSSDPYQLRRVYISDCDGATFAEKLSRWS